MSNDAKQKSPQKTEDNNGDNLEEAIAQLTPEQAEMFMDALAYTVKKRNLMYYGTFLSLFLLTGGSIGALFYFFSLPASSFRMWVFLVPFGSAGFSLWFFGKMAHRVGRSAS